MLYICKFRNKFDLNTSNKCFLKPGLKSFITLGLQEDVQPERRVRRVHHLPRRRRRNAVPDCRRLRTEGHRPQYPWHSVTAGENRIKLFTVVIYEF
jgi:hypothetical protein